MGVKSVEYVTLLKQRTAFRITYPIELALLGIFRFLAALASSSCKSIPYLITPPYHSHCHLSLTALQPGEMNNSFYTSNW